MEFVCSVSWLVSNAICQFAPACSHMMPELSLFPLFISRREGRANANISGSEDDVWPTEINREGECSGRGRLASLHFLFFLPEFGPKLLLSRVD